MEVLEIKPIEKKSVDIHIIEIKNHDLTLVESKYLKKMLDNVTYDFITVGLNDIDVISFRKTELTKFFNSINIPIEELDIPEFVKGYLDIQITEKKEQIWELEKEYNSSEQIEKDSFKFQNLKSWIDLLKSEVQEKENYLKLKLRPQWIVKRISEMINKSDGKNIKVLHFTAKEQIDELKKQFSELGIKISIENLQKNVSQKSVMLENKQITSTHIV